MEKYTVLAKEDLDSDPFRQFSKWRQQALDAQIDSELVDAMTLATATPDGIPSARVVMLRGFDERGFVFYTNYDSPKSQDLTVNPRAALVFYWHSQERQIRIDGSVKKISREESQDYFATRPRGSRIEAWISNQSQTLESREVLEKRFAEIEAQYHDQDIPLPPHWGGFRVIPEMIEFWQSGPYRMHNRFRYMREGKLWSMERLFP